MKDLKNNKKNNVIGTAAATVMAFLTLAAPLLFLLPLSLQQQSSAAVISSEGPSARAYSSPRASIAASDSNVYVSWWDNRTAGNNEIFFALSTDNGQTFGEPIMLNATRPPPAANAATTTTTAAGEEEGEAE